MPFYPLEKPENLHNGYMRAFAVGNESLLLIQSNDTPYLIENRCGHFGVPLDSGDVENGTIVCSQHGISFSLEAGEIVNRPYENADPVRVFQISCQDGYLGVVLAGEGEKK